MHARTHARTHTHTNTHRYGVEEIEEAIGVDGEEEYDKQARNGEEEDAQARCAVGMSFTVNDLKGFKDLKGF